MNFNRRDLLKYGLVGAGSTLLPLSLLGAPRQDDHFIYFLFMEGGADFTNLFDARPLEMTKNKLLVNHVGEEPYPWKGTNGGETLASALTKPLKVFKEDLAIINGVFMDATFVGHPNVTNILFSGDPFKGHAFLPWINKESGNTLSCPLDGIRRGRFLNSLQVASGHSGIVELEGQDTQRLVDRLQIQSNLSQSQKAWSYILARAEAAGHGQGQFSKGSQNLLNSTRSAQDLSNKFATLDLENLNSDPELKFLELFTYMSKNKMIKASVEVTEQFNLTNGQQGRFPFDSHSIGSASDHRNMYSNLVDKLAKTLKFFKETEFDSTRSMLDVTTVVVATEFGRTMRQNYVTSFDVSGTDHNPFCNSFIMAGKGVRGNTVIGSSDFKTSDEELSKAHLEIDPEKLNLMARPFDFKNQHVLNTMPEKFNVDDYLTSGSVMNTLFSLFDLPSNRLRRKSQGGEVYPLLTGLLQ